MVSRIALLALFYLVFSVWNAPAEEPEKEMAATSAVGKWLSIVDNGQYADRWE